jgi:hypothetical protein
MKIQDITPLMEVQDTTDNCRAYIVIRVGRCRVRVAEPSQNPNHIQQTKVLDAWQLEPIIYK